MSKSNEKSNSLRIEGNQFFSQKCYYNAMLKYNESLCFAEPNNGQMMGLAYGNRSAIYFEMKLFRKCLININLAKKNQFPETNVDVLNKREEKCLMFLKKTNGDKNNSDDFFQLSYPPHKNVPFIADCLELKYDNVYGRHIVTNKPLKAGDVIAIEQPFSKIVQDSFIHQICSWCFDDNLMDLKPCSMCTKAMFCSEECDAKALECFHKYECPLREMTSILNTTVQMALRTFFVALSIFDHSLDDLKNYLIEHSKPCTIFDFNEKQSKEPKNKFFAINSLMANDEIDGQGEMFEKIFQVTPKLKEMWSNYDDFIANFLKRQLQIGTLNYHEMYVWPLKKGGLQDNDVDEFKNSLAYQRGTIAAGSGSYPFTSLLNHDCAPNISRIFINGKIILIVQRTINKGDQIFDNYGYHFTNTPKDYRHSELLKQYKFECNCSACSNDWPMLSALKICDKMCLNRAKKECRELTLTDLNRKKVISKYHELCGIINKNHKNFPSLEICSIMQSAVAYLEMIAKPHLQLS